MGTACGCFAGLTSEVSAKASDPPLLAGVPAISSSDGRQGSQTSSKPAADEKGYDLLEDIKTWKPGIGGIVDISPDSSSSVLLKPPDEIDKEARAPADGAEVSLDVEVLEVRESSLETRLACRGLRTASGSGEVRLPEELELAIPHLKKPAGTFIILCDSFCQFGALPETGVWQALAPCFGKKVILRIELVEVQDLCLATLEGHERLEYAKGRKDAGSKFFKREKFEPALERYSLAAEMLTHRDDIKDNALWAQAQEVRALSELNAAACLLKLEKWREAEAVCNAILRASPDNEKALFRRAKALLALGDAARAGVDLRRVLEVNSSNAEAKQLLQKARQEGKGTEKEKKVYAKMLK
ncbi:FKBP70 [Symbiodinium pilosum]|uniref:FKBP70 protein n=1 Tax=Symbiodinium pilosum TaxID=2952 RepID=A0A812LFK7_SYMPI|nr:FKBP70 [Symbiodinium pilosum]